MSEVVRIEKVVIFAKLSDGTVKEIFIPEKDQKRLINNLQRTYSPLRIVDVDVTGRIDFFKP